MGRAPCCEKVGLKRGRWTTEEDNILSNYIQSHGEGSWRALPKNAGLLRCGKSCRLRWVNYLKTDLKRGKFSSAEDDVIIRMHASLGNRWSTIAGSLPGRTDNEIKNYWNSHLSRQIYTYRKRPNIVSNPIQLPPPITPPAVMNLPNPTAGNNNGHKRKGGRASRHAMKKNKLISLQPHKQRHNHPPPNANGIDELQNEVTSSVPMQPTTTTNLGEEANAIIINDDDASSSLVNNLLDDSYCGDIDYDVFIDGILLQGVDINGAHMLHDTLVQEETRGGPHIDLNKLKVSTESDVELSSYNQLQQTTTSADESNFGDEGKILNQDFEMMGWDFSNDHWDVDGSIEGLDICNTERDILFSRLLDDKLDDTDWTTSDQLF